MPRRQWYLFGDNDVFKLREEIHYHLRYNTQFLVDLIHSVFNGSESASYLGPKIWEQVHTQKNNKQTNKKDSLLGFN